ncbi:MAG: hypothetical protein AMXMBFR82_03950 [Candidatus Hydrogenedentota bacterium]
MEAAKSTKSALFDSTMGRGFVRGYGGPAWEFPLNHARQKVGVAAGSKDIQQVRIGVPYV